MIIINVIKNQKFVLILKKGINVLAKKDMRDQMVHVFQFVKMDVHTVYAMNQEYVNVILVLWEKIANYSVNAMVTANVGKNWMIVCLARIIQWARDVPSVNQCLLEVILFSLYFEASDLYACNTYFFRSSE
jgi:hypothetical protein